MTLDSKGELFDKEILSEVEGLGNLMDEMADKVKQEDEQRNRTHKRRNPRDEAALHDDETPPDDFRDLSIVPTLEDVHATGRSFIRRNKIDGRYEHYLDVQFRLLREDFVGPLRDGINELLMKMGSAKMGPLQVGPHLTLTCKNHPKNIIHASKAEDFRGAPEGGCMERCNARLDCGHVCTMVCPPIDSNHEEYKCRQNCSDCFQGRLHRQCKAKCNRPLFCGHLCKEACTRNCPPCKNPCENQCVHSKCPKKCGEPCTPCMMKCAWACQHHKCNQLCGQPCDRQRCNAPCRKNLRCGHPCIGMCGEPCPKKCRVCNKDEVTQILFGEEDELDARFVELQGCGHVIEVQAMDHYMDDVSDDVSDNASSVQLKGCPWCKTLIRTTLRYGDIIKSKLEDFEHIKSKLIVPDYKLKLERERLHNKLSGMKVHKDILKDIQSISVALQTMKGLTSDQVNMYENQINFMNFLNKILRSIRKFSKSMASLGEHDIEMITTPLLVEVFALKARIMQIRSRFSEQEKEEINEELFKVSLLTSYRLLVHQIERKNIHLGHLDKYTLNNIGDVLKSGKRIDKEHLKRYENKMEKISKNYSGLSVTLTNEEKDMIVKAMGMSQGHWFKCPKGHIYCIGDCGGATVESRCPECGSTIGGTNHAIRSDNTLAREMDGAQHAAWSNVTNNMRNFDLDGI